MEENQNEGMARGCLILGLAAVGLVALIIFLLVISGGKDTQQPAATSAPAATAAVAATPMPIDDVVADLDEKVAGIFDRYEITVKDKIITVQTWIDGITEAAYIAKTSGGDTLTQWNELVESVRKSSEAEKNAIDVSGNTDYHSAFYLMSDTNEENALAIVLDGTVMFDEVNGVNLLGK